MASEFMISQDPFVQKCKRLAKSRNLYLDVKDGSIRLGWSALSEDGRPNEIQYINKAEASSLGIHYELLINAVLKCGGAIDRNGHYPVTEEIIGRLRKVKPRK